MAKAANAIPTTEDGAQVTYCGSPIYDPETFYMFREDLALEYGCKVAVLSADKASRCGWRILSTGTIGTKAFPNCEEFWVDTAQMAIDKGAPRSLAFDTAYLTETGSYADHEYKVCRVTQVAHSI